MANGTLSLDAGTDCRGRNRTRCCPEEFATPDIADALDVLGYPDQTAFGIRRTWDGCPRVAGRVTHIPLGPDEFGSTVAGTFEAIQTADRGDVPLFDD